ncbi:Uncharacterized protein FWK35_00030081, partial [Aphis craccivora]
MNSERSDGYIDFTMLCVFFVLCLCTRESVEIMLQFQTLGVVSDSKINVHWGGHFLNFPIVFKSAGKNQKKIKEKREFLRKISFRPKRFFYMVLIQKLITLNFQEILTFFDVDKKILDDQKICRKRENLQ